MTLEIHLEREQLNGKKNNIKLLILILICISTNLLSIEHNESTIKNEIRKDLTSSLLVNLLYDNVLDGNYRRFHSDINNILLDYNRLYLLSISNSNDTIEYYDEKYTIIKYEFKFVNSNDQESWNDSTIGPGSSIKQLMSSNTYTPRQIFGYEKYKLFENGLYFQSIRTKELKKMSMNNDCYTDLDSLSMDKFHKEIFYRFYHYLPEEIKIDFSNSSFSFFSKVLERYFDGKIVYNQLSYRYQLKLSNGLLK